MKNLREIGPNPGRPFASKPLEQRSLVAMVESTFGTLMRYASRRGYPFSSLREPPLKYQEDRYIGEPPHELSLYIDTGRRPLMELEIHRALADTIQYMNYTETGRLWTCRLTEGMRDHPTGNTRTTTVRIPSNPDNEITVREQWYGQTNDSFRDVEVAEITNDQCALNDSQKALGRMTAALLYAAIHAPVEQLIFTRSLGVDWQEHTFAQHGSAVGRAAVGELIGLAA